MNLNVTSITNKISPLVNFIKRHYIVIFIMIFFTMYAFLVIKINQVAQQEPDATALTEKEQTIKTLQIDQEAVNKMTELEDQNVEVKALFEKARDNPFTE